MHWRFQFQTAWSSPRGVSLDVELIQLAMASRQLNFKKRVIHHQWNANKWLPPGFTSWMAKYFGLMEMAQQPKASSLMVMWIKLDGADKKPCMSKR